MLKMIEMRRLPPRIGGLALLAASGCTTIVHRAIYEAARHGPAQIGEFAIGLLTFCLASTGVLLLIHGAELFEPVTMTPRHPEQHDTPHETHPARPDLPDIEALDTKLGVALALARRAIRTAVADLQSRDRARADLSHGNTRGR